MTAASDAELLRRYDRPGPRYTSYPTAPQFDAAFGEAEFCERARLSNEELIPRRLSLYVHVPFCFSPCFYCGCNHIITRDPLKGELYGFVTAAIAGFMLTAVPSWTGKRGFSGRPLVLLALVWLAGRHRYSCGRAPTANRDSPAAVRPA